MRLEFYQACILSSILHGVILFGVFPRQRGIIHVPLSVELIKIPSTVPDVIEKKVEDIAVKKKTGKLIEEKKEDPAKLKKKLVSQPHTTTRLTLEAAKFPYMYYLNMIRKKVSMHWDWPDTKGTYKTVVYFKILHFGEVIGVQLDTQSHNQLFDDAALRAIKLSDPFSPLPGGFKEEYLGVYFEFSFME